MSKINILFVCAGNICRSPTVQAVFSYHVSAAGLEQHIHCDSAGTNGFHAGEPPDERAQRHAAKRGYDLSVLRARLVEKSDFERFDYVLAMDENNLSSLARNCPDAYAAKIALLMNYGTQGIASTVPDPYYGSAKGFERVLDMAEDAAQGLLRHIRDRYQL